MGNLPQELAILPTTDAYGTSSSDYWGEGSSPYETHKVFCTIVDYKYGYDYVYDYSYDDYEREYDDYSYERDDAQQTRAHSEFF